MNATFSVYFRDTTFRAIALHDFTEMLKGKYEKERVVFVVSEERMRFKSRDLHEAMTGSKLQG